MDMKALMQQANQMQKKLKKIEAELDESIYEGANNGVSVKINGKNEVLEVNIDEELCEKDNKDMLQDMILIAMNDALSKASDDRATKMSAVTGGISIPGM